MKTVDVNGTILEIHTEIEQMPAVRYKDFNKYLLLDSGVGATINDINTRFGNLFAFLAGDKPQEALKEAENLFYTHYYILEKVNHEQRAFACLVYSINGKTVDDFSTDNLDAIIAQLSAAGLTQDIVEKLVTEVKKKPVNN